MDIEEVRRYALSLSPHATESLFADEWLDFRVAGKWFMLMPLDAPEPRVAVKLPPERGIDMRERYAGISAAYHMNKKHWNDLYLERLPDEVVQTLIAESYDAVVATLPKRLQRQYARP